MQHQDTAPRQRSSRHHRVDEDFLAILEEDFGISQFALRRAFLGMPPVPKKQAIELCEWATRSAAGADPDEAGDALRAWARKNRRGQFDPRLQDGEPMTFAGVEARGV
jgi:Zn-dependent peptidase ImmA (M78 family)